MDTGLKSLTGERVRRVKDYIDGEEFMLTYGDGVADIDIKKLADFHKKRGGSVTMTAIQLMGRFGSVEIGENERVNAFIEKPQGDGAWINGGFFVMEPDAFDYIKDGDATIWERKPLEGLAADGRLNAYRHKGFWKCMDTLRDKTELETLWNTGNPPWRVWE